MLGHATAHYCNYAKAPWYESEFTALLAAAGVPNADATHIYVGSSLFMAWNMGAPGRSAFVSVPKQVKVLSHGISAGFTGEVLLLVMMIIYAAANDKVKRSHYETFWCQPPRRRRTAAPALRLPCHPRPTSPNKPPTQSRPGPRPRRQVRAPLLHSVVHIPAAARPRLVVLGALHPRSVRDGPAGPRLLPR